MKTRKPYKSRWFYAFGPSKEMIIDNNQNKLARIFSLSQGVISACLRGERREHKGWQFTLIENPCYFKEAEKEIEPEAFAEETETDQRDLTPQEREKTEAKHVQAAIMAGIRHLMEDFYPGWVNTKDTGHLFITD